MTGVESLPAVGEGVPAVPSVPGLTVSRKVLRQAISYMDSYSHKTLREACGLILSWKDAESGHEMWSWQGVANVHVSPRHNFTLEPIRVRRLERTLTETGVPGSGRVRAVVHSHPFAEMGGLGWNGPSSPDVANTRSAEQACMGSFGTTDLVPESIVWLPLSGSGGKIISYNGEGGFKWSIDL